MLTSQPPKQLPDHPTEPQPPSGAYALSSSRADTYHDHDSVLKWALRLEAASWLPLVLGAAASLSLIPEVFNLIQDALRGPGYFQLELTLNLLIPAAIAITSLTLFLLLRAASHGLLILLDVEDNTRPQQHASNSDTTDSPTSRNSE